MTFITVSKGDNMKTLLLIMAMTLLGGCNALEKLTGQEKSESHKDPIIQDFHGQVTGPSPIIITETPNQQTFVLEVFACTNGCVQVDLLAYSIPVYDSVQPSVTSPYAHWNYVYPMLQVTFENYTPSDTVRYMLRSK